MIIMMMFMKMMTKQLSFIRKMIIILLLVMMILLMIAIKSIYSIIINDLDNDGDSQESSPNTKTINENTNRNQNSNSDKNDVEYWCPKPCWCQEEFDQQQTSVKQLATFWLPSSSSTFSSDPNRLDETIGRRRYQINKHSSSSSNMNGQLNTTDGDSRMDPTITPSSPLKTTAVFIAIDCGRKKIDDLQTLPLENSFSELHRQRQQQSSPKAIIRTLVLSHNQIKSIDSEHFGNEYYWQTNLIALWLDDNLLQWIPSEVFSEFSSLQYLNLAFNRINRLEPKSFIGLRNLLKLDLGSNQIKTFPSGIISPSILVSLTEINLRQNQIEKIPANAFTRNDFFDDFNYDDDVQNESNGKSFVKISYQNETIMMISDDEERRDNNQNQNLASKLNRTISTPLNLLPVSTREPRLMIKSSPIVNFDLSFNPLQEIHFNAFEQMPKLRKIYLSEIRQQKVFPNLFGCDSLEHIRFDRSRLISISDNLCQQVGRTLKSLDVRSNQIDRIPPLNDCRHLRLIDLSYNEINRIRPRTFVNLSKLIDLSLNHNLIDVIEEETFVGLKSLKVLNMESNRIEQIDPKAFVPLRSLRDLNLGYNQFPDLPTEGITNIIEIKVHGNRNLREFPPVESFPFVQTLAMSYAYHCCLFQDRKQLINSELSSGSLDQLSRFPDTHDSILWLENIKDDNVNLTIDELAQQFWKLYNPQNSIPDIESNDDKRDGFSTNPQQNLNFDMFVNDLHTALRSPNIYQRINMIDDDENLESRVYFQQNSYQTDKPVRCLPRPDPFLPCKDLFDWWTLRLGVWIVFPLALIGNGTVLVVLVFGRRKRRRSSKLDVPRFLVCNLAVADFFMGIYLSMLAIMDAITFGYFRSYAIRWQNSFICQFTGFTGVFSAELSVYTLAVITLERNYAITHAMHLNKRLSLRAASIVMSFGWFFALLMATLPLFGVNDYRKVAVCLPFEIDNLVSLCYVIILIVFNGLAFILLMGCYLRMYCAIRGSQAWNSNDTKIAMRMALLVFTDFLCWAPIAFFTITALLGWQLITLEEAKIFTIFVLPLNACANPFLYAFFTKQFKKECNNLYKRVESIKFFHHHHRRSRQFDHGGGAGGGCRQSNQTTTPPSLLSDCKICGHRENDVQKFFPNVPEFHQYHVRQKDCKKEDNDDAENDKVEKDNKIEQKSEILKQIERDNEERLHRNGNPDGCECQCHQKRRQQHHRHYHHRHQVLAKQPRSKQLSLKDTETIENNQTYGGLFFRNLLSPTLKNIRRTSSSQSKQFKSNSIIYQSNYRKNHIHMTFEEELLHSPLPPNSNEINDDPECSEMKRKFQRISQRQNHQSSRNESYASSMVIGSNQSNRNGNQKEMTEEKQNQKSEENRSNRSDRDDHRRYIKHHHPTTRAMTTGILMLKNKLTRNNKNYVRKLSSDSQYEFSYYSNRKDSTSTTGRLSISSDNPTKSTTSSTFISSGIWNSSTTNQRSSLSNPNENASDSDNNNGDDQQEKELVLNYNQYQRMIELSIRFDARIKNHLLESNNEIDLECKNILEKTSKTTGYILLDFFLNDFYDMVSRKHHLAHPETYRIHNNDQNEIDDDETEQSYRKDLEDYNRAKHIDSEREKSENFDEKNKKKFATDKRKLMILFLLDKIDPATLNRFDCFFSNLEVLLLLERNVDGDGDETSESKRIRLKLGDCQECLELFLIENLINYLDEGFCHIPDEKYFQTLMIDSLIFRCDLTIHRRELMEINEESFTPNSLVSDRYSNGNFNDCSNGQQTKSSKRSPASKMMNSSHEKIMTFIQNLLTKSNGKHSQTEESSSTRRKRSNRSTMRALRRKHPKSIVTEAINQCGKRRSSSAFALSEEIYTKFPEIIYDKQMYVKSCSQLQVLESNESSNSNLNKSDSIPDVRSRSAISDVIIRINEDAIQKSSSNSVYGGSGGITTMLTTNTTTFGTFKTEKILIPTFNSDREISYDGDGFERHRYHHTHKTLHIDEQNNHYHSYEFIA